MAISYRGKEDFLKEIYSYQLLNDTTLLEAIVEYQKKYDLDEDYIIKNLFTPTLYEKIRNEAEYFNLIKREKRQRQLDGI